MNLELTHGMLLASAIFFLILYFCYAYKRQMFSMLFMGLLTYLSLTVKIPIELKDSNGKVFIKKMSTIRFFRMKSTESVGTKTGLVVHKQEKCSVGYWVVPGKYRGYKDGVQTNKYHTIVVFEREVVKVAGQPYFYSEKNLVDKSYTKFGDCMEI